MKPPQICWWKVFGNLHQKNGIHKPILQWCSLTLVSNFWIRFSHQWMVGSTSNCSPSWTHLGKVFPTNSAFGNFGTNLGEMKWSNHSRSSSLVSYKLPRWTYAPAGVSWPIVWVVPLPSSSGKPQLNMKQSWWSLLLGRGTTQPIVIMTWNIFRSTGIWLSNEKRAPGCFGLDRALYYPVIWGL